MLLSSSKPKQDDATSFRGACELVASPESLSGMALLHAAYSQEGTSLVGSPTAGFAYYLNSTDTIVVVSENDKKVRNVSPDTIFATDVMDVAQDLGASFTVARGTVVCNIRGVSQSGCTYSEAALRTILALAREESPESSRP